MPKLYGIKLEQDKLAIANVLVKYGYTVRITTEKSITTNKLEKVLEYFKDIKEIR